MSDPVPLKMSQFDITATFPSGSYFIAVVPDGSTFKNVRVDPSTVLSSIYSNRWKSVPEHSFSPGNDGDEAKDSSFYYLNIGGVGGSGGVWYRNTHDSLF